MSQQQTTLTAIPPAKQTFLPLRFWVVSWSSQAATRVFLPMTKGGRGDWQPGNKVDIDGDKNFYILTIAFGPFSDLHLLQRKLLKTNFCWNLPLSY